MRGDREKFLVIDGHSMIYRSIYRPGKPLTAPSGEPTRGTYTFCQTLFSLVDELKPSYIAMAVDPPRATTFRRKLWSGYKAKRDEEGPPPKENVIQLQRCRQIVRALGVAVIEVDGFEADDVVASLVDACGSDEVECVIVSRDKDMHQLVDLDCRMFDPFSNEWIDSRWVENKWNVLHPRQVIEVQTLAGDSTDGIPGVRGIGLGKAAKLINRYGDVKTLVQKKDELTPAVRRSLEEADLKLCRQLVELRRDVPIDISARELEFDRFQMDDVAPLFRKLGFRTFLNC